MGDVLDFVAYRRRKLRTPHYDAMPANRPHWTEPCTHCGKPIGEGLQIVIGAAPYHGKLGACRRAALEWLTPQEQEYSENARRARLYSHSGTEPMQCYGGLGGGLAQCTFPPRVESEAGNA